MSWRARVCLVTILLGLALPTASASAAGSGSSALDFRFSTPWTVPAGESVEVEVWLRNVGAQPLDVKVLLEPTGPASQRALAVEPGFRKTTLAPREDRSMAFSILAQASTPPGKYAVTVFARWTQEGRAQEEIHQLSLSVTPGAAPPEREPSRLDPFVMALVGGMGSGAGIAAIGLWARRQDWALLKAATAGAFYSRIRRSDALDQETRRRVYEAIVESPGIRFSQLRRRTGLSNGALYHHLSKLAEHGLIASHRQGAQRLFTAAGVAPEPRALVTPAEKDLLALVPPEGITQSELATRLGMTRQGASYHLNNLRFKRVLRRRLVRGRWRYYVADTESSGFHGSADRVE